MPAERQPTRSKLGKISHHSAIALAREPSGRREPADLGHETRRKRSAEHQLSSAQLGQNSWQVVWLGKDVAGLGALARTDDVAALHEVHEPSGLGEADAQLALEHRGRPELSGYHQLDRLHQQVQVVADLLV